MFSVFKNNVDGLHRLMAMAVYIIHDTGDRDDIADYPAMSSLSMLVHKCT